MSHLLLLMIFVPLIGIAFTALVKRGEIRTAKNCKDIRAIIAASEVILCIIALFYFDKETSEFWGGELFSWLDGFNYYLGADGLSLLFLSAAALLFLFIIILDWNVKTKMTKEYNIFFLWLQSMIMGMFVASDISLFTFFFIAFPIPLFLLLKLWGVGKDKPYNNQLLLINTCAGALFLISVFSYPEMQILSVTGLLFSYLIIGALFPILAINNNARAETSPAVLCATSTLPVLAGVYGFSKTFISYFYEVKPLFAAPIIIIASLLFLFFSLKAFTQKDFLKLISCFISATICIIFMGIFLSTTIAIEGAIYLSLNLVFIVTALLLCAHIIWERTTSLHIFEINGLFTTMPLFSSLFFITVITVVSFPLTGGFIGYFLMIYESFKDEIFISLFLIFSMILTAIYLINAYQKMMQGASPEKFLDIKDISLKEGLFIILCLSFSFGLGLFPDWFLGFFDNLMIGGIL